MGKILTTVLAASVAVCALQADAAEYSTSFAKGAWNESEWELVKSPRFSYLGTMVQLDDCITNKTPDLSDEEIFKNHGADVYSCIMLKKEFNAKKTVVSSEMSFDHLMAPLIVIAGEIGKDAKGTPEHREHFEVVLYNEGLNVWHHTYKDGKPGWHLAAFLKAKFEPKKQYRLIVEIKTTPKGKVMTVTCGDHTFGYMDDALPEKFRTGIIGCEGKNRFYDFKVSEQKE